MRRLLIWVVNPLFYLYTLVYCAVFFVLTFLAWLLTFWWQRRRTLVHYVMGIWCYGYVSLNPFWRLRITGRDRIPHGACVLASNHQSMLDIVLLFCLLRPFKWVAKIELFSLPFLGWLLRMGGYVSIDRGSLRDSQRLVGRCVGWLKMGVSIMIFPEGTRSRTGRVGSFRSGAGQIAKAAGVPIVPLAISGPRETLDGFRLRLRRVEFRIEVLEPIGVDTVAALEAEALCAVAHERVLAAHRQQVPALYGE